MRYNNNIFSGLLIHFLIVKWFKVLISISIIWSNQVVHNMTVPVWKPTHLKPTHIQNMGKPLRSFKAQEGALCFLGNSIVKLKPRHIWSIFEQFRSFFSGLKTFYGIQYVLVWRALIVLILPCCPGWETRSEVACTQLFKPLQHCQCRKRQHWQFIGKTISSKNRDGGHYVSCPKCRSQSAIWWWLLHWHRVWSTISGTFSSALLVSCILYLAHYIWASFSIWVSVCSTDCSFWSPLLVCCSII